MLADICVAHVPCINCYSPTETTVVNIMHGHQPGQPLSVERPTPWNKRYTLDEPLVPATVGEIGVSWAGSSEVSRGYMDLPEKTAERFRFDPYSQDGTKMYDTGDLCQWNRSGTITFLGPVNDHVKVKGFCVELDGVIAALNSCPSVQGAAALLIDGEIHAFVTPRHCPLPVIQDHLEAHQPYYAIPTRYHFFDALPLAEKGKLDKKALRHIASTPQDPISTGKKAPYGHIHPPKPARLGHSRSDSSASSAPQTSSFSDPSDATLVEEQIDLEAALPDKKHRKYSRGLRYGVLIIYWRLSSLVGLFNTSAAIALVMTGISREWLSNITAINLAMAVLVRQDFVINVLYTIACSAPKSWPLFIRARFAKIYHLGGVHSGAAVSAGAWLLAANIADIVCMVSGSFSNWGKQSITSNVISWALSALFAVMIGLAWPSMRKRHHDLFERTHRFIGWTMLVFFWVQVIIASKDNAATGTSLGQACARSPPFWLLAVATVSVASSWFFLRKVPVQAEKMSDHAIRLHFGYTVPVNGSFARLSYNPLVEWHSFATIPAPEAVNGRPKGYSLIVSNAGDWTKSTIQDSPSHIWIRGVPTCGAMRIATLFNRVVLIATGSGIGPMLGYIQSPSGGTQLIWSTKQPEEAFGEDLCRTVTKIFPNAIIHDTKKQGRPDLVKMGYNLAKSCKAEAVIIIANEKTTKKVVYGLETRGVPAYGAIWDC
ncbi:uncharacterized protein BKA55DRAFT_263628 [Fusarium redolens]|uniref:AMP-dependent synthetase/ligase domain-containing protein n=1 Tax=Fusarium redolens TaxID=48865 RepID=A0A9P9JKF5_FUSRE|nr:uncharacterized protein BKA55DRAFT_263628 [Fusarium redolens]KAH7207856.1 hypothetical protein BKA55DRAFT_263628 [Fusarium redolens]